MYRVPAALLAVLLATPATRAAEPLRFADLIGWWCGEPTYAGESSRVCLRFAEEESRQTVRLSLLGIGGYDVPIGTVTVSGASLDMQPYPFPLSYDAAKGTLSGVLPEAAVPIYKIPIELRRVESVAKPAAPTWDLPRPRVAWTVDVGSPVWAGLERDARSGRIYVGAEDGTLHAIDARGVERWTFVTGKPIKARPAVIADAVYVASDSGFLYKLGKDDGRERWRARIDTGSPARIPTTEEKSRWDRYGSSVVSDGTRVYVASRDRNLYALDAATGKERWRVETGDMMTATPALDRGRVLFASFDGKVQAVDAKDGKRRWMYDAKLPVAGDLVVAGGRVFVGSRTYELIALDAGSGKELWKHYYWFSWIESPPLVRGDTVYTGSSDGTAVFAIDVANGHLRWKTHVPGWAWARTAVSDTLVVSGSVGVRAFPGVRSGGLVALDRATGKPQWLYVDPPDQEVVDKRIEWGFGASPLIADGVTYAADLRGRIYALYAADD